MCFFCLFFNLKKFKNLKYFLNLKPFSEARAGALPLLSPQGGWGGGAINHV